MKRLVEELLVVLLLEKLKLNLVMLVLVFPRATLQWDCAPVRRRGLGQTPPTALLALGRARAGAVIFVVVLTLSVPMVILNSIISIVGRVNVEEEEGGTLVLSLRMEMIRKNSGRIVTPLPPALESAV
jgi:hypothetical protein|tara:strand:+ start:95 stop:478 length:384 start_codon:yes stop_codon:yes gene_type:complete